MFKVCCADFANDIIVVRQRDDTLCCSPVNVRFQHEGDVRNRNDKNVTVSINGEGFMKFSLNELRNESNDRGFRFTSSCLESMRLRPDLNHITFTIELRGEEVEVKARMFLWPWDSLIVITDVDGTITKSDKRGIVMRILGLDWNQDGVCHLFSAIQKNGYQVIYLTGRPRYEVEATRNLVDNVQQDNEDLPKGPVIVSPDGFGSAVCREAADTQDTDFKIPVLKQIRRLFPNSHHPFHAGFGNRPSDERAYRECKVPGNRIFHLNRSKRRIEVKCGAVTVCDYFPGNYIGLHRNLNKLFPPVDPWAWWTWWVKSWFTSYP